MQGGELRSLLRYLLYIGELWKSDRHSDCGCHFAAECGWQRVLGLDCVYGLELGGGHAVFHRGEGYGWWLDSVEEAFLMGPRDFSAGLEESS